MLQELPGLSSSRIMATGRRAATESSWSTITKTCMRNRFHTFVHIHIFTLVNHAPRNYKSSENLVGLGGHRLIGHSRDGKFFNCSTKTDRNCVSHWLLPGRGEFKKNPPCARGQEVWLRGWETCPTCRVSSILRVHGQSGVLLFGFAVQNQQDDVTTVQLWQKSWWGSNWTH